MVVDGKLWIALQTNVLSDQIVTNYDFKDKFQEVMSNMTALFSIPNLTRNMRNGEKINKASKGVGDAAGFYNVNNTNEILPPPTTSSSNEEPILIPVNEKYFEFYFQSMLDEKVFNPKKKTLILHTESFLEKELKILLQL